MSLFGKSNKHKKNLIREYTVFPPDGITLKHATITDNGNVFDNMKKFKYKKNAFKYALSLGVGAKIGVNVECVHIKNL
jgi:hypothetical protein